MPAPIAPSPIAIWFAAPVGLAAADAADDALLATEDTEALRLVDAALKDEVRAAREEESEPLEPKLLEEAVPVVVAPAAPVVPE